jgi:hypothetical protein
MRARKAARPAVRSSRTLLEVFVVKRIQVLWTFLALAMATMGCESKAKVEKKETVTTPGGSTTTTDEHTVESSGKNPPGNSRGEKAN